MANLVSKTVGGLPPLSVQLDIPGNALTVGGWIRLGGRVKTSGVGRGLFWRNPFSQQQSCSVEALTGRYLVLNLP